MIKKLAKDIQDEALFNPDDRIVVGVSGGPDSMALLHALLTLNQQLGWSLAIHVAHLHHGLRGADADADAAFVQAAADGMNLACTVERRDIARIAAEQGMGVEEAGRQERYAFLNAVSLKANARVVALGHHADDNAETILHRILRGTGLRGLSGIHRARALAPNSNVRIVRPMLRWRKSQVLEFLSNAGVAYREDATNAAPELTRNRIRNTVLPLLEDHVNPQVRDALIRLGEQAEWLEEFLSETVQRTFETLIISRNDQELVLNVDALARKSRIVQTELIRLGYRSFGLGEQDLSFTHLVAGLELIADQGSGKQSVMPGGLTIEKRYHQLIFSLPTEVAREMIAPEIAVTVPGKTCLPIRCLEIECTLFDVKPEDVPDLRRRGGRMEEFVDYEAVRPPVVVRSRRPGDRFFPLGAPGSKKVNDFLASVRIEPREREKVAVMCDHLGPIWLIGHRIDERVKLTPGTRRVLRLRAASLPGG